MGFNVTALAQKARTKTLIVDSDLNMEQYDVIATDVKGDTAEFSEFVGGVGNFESGLVSGGFDVSGILHAESNLQVDGGISLEGSINNVNITPEGEIITAQNVNASEFVGNMGNFEQINVPITTNITSIKLGQVSNNNTYNPNIAYSSGVTADLIEEFEFNPITTDIPEFFNINMSDDMSYTLTLATRTTGLNAYASYYLEINGTSTLLYGNIPSGGQTYNFDVHAGDKIRYYMVYTGTDTGRYVFTITLKCNMSIYLA